MAVLSSLIGGGNAIKSIQYVTAARTTNTDDETINVTITSVDTSKTIVIPSFVTPETSVFINYKLSSSTNLEVHSRTTVAYTGSQSVPEWFFMVVEFY